MDEGEFTELYGELVRKGRAPLAQSGDDDALRLAAGGSREPCSATRQGGEGPSVDYDWACDNFDRLCALADECGQTVSVCDEGRVVALVASVDERSGDAVDALLERWRSALAQVNAPARLSEAVLGKAKRCRRDRFHEGRSSARTEPGLGE
ncbi:hypothetical protein [Arabiibacter massiliensis]|uniref:hypothetical protein n=1 Tax=Arabiibacter massiliensis TaxID=1870985 RepID=UPI0009B9A332|nr:hypothetical protein [Arabiibacter massiliensis]